MDNLRELLKEELAARKERNESYSMRSFASFLGMSPASLSQFMSYKRGISGAKATLILQKLGVSPKESMYYLSKINGGETVIPKVTESESRQILREDTFKLISEWYHFALLSFSELRIKTKDSRIIGKALGVKSELINSAYSRLLRLGIIQEFPKSFKQLIPPFSTTEDIPSEVIQKYHKEALKLAADRIERVEPELREFSSLTLAINTKKLARAKELIRQFCDDMEDVLETGPKDEVYQFNIQLFPLTNTKEIKKEDL